MSGDSQINTAEAMFHAGNLSGAERLVRAMLDRDPHDRDGLLMLAMIEDKRENHDTAFDLQDRLLARDPFDDDVRLMRFYTLLHLKRFDDAKEAIADFERDFPDSGHLRLMRIAMGMAPVDLVATKEEAARLRAEKGDCYEVQITDAAVAFGEHRNADAYRHALAALAHQPQDGFAHDMAANAAFWSLRPRLARRHAEQALRIEPGMTGMRGLIRMSRAVWFPPAGFTYVCWVGQNMLAGKTGTLVSAIVFFLLCKFLIGPVLASVVPWQLLLGFVGCLMASLAYFLVETSLIPRRERNRSAVAVALKDY